MNEALTLRSGLEAGGAPALWERVFTDALPAMRTLAPPGSRVLEVGFGNGLLSCFLCRELGWRLEGLEVKEEVQREASANAERFGLSEAATFRFVRPEETRKHRGLYDAVFMKTVLYGSASLDEYAEWLEWVLSVLKPGGALIEFESGRANALTQLYRRIRRRVYTGLCLYTGKVETLYDERFEIVERRYYGGVSQFLAPLPPFYRLAACIEESVRAGCADNCFAVSVMARKRLAGADGG